MKKIVSSALLLLSLCAFAQSDSLQREQKTNSTGYNAAIAEGDSAFKACKIAEAKQCYQQARTFNPGDVYAAQQIRKCDDWMASHCPGNTKYLSLIQIADSLFKAGDYAAAKLNYQRASAVMATEDYPKNQIIQCDQFMKKD